MSMTMSITLYSLFISTQRESSKQRSPAPSTSSDVIICAGGDERLQPAARVTSSQPEKPARRGRGPAAAAQLEARTEGSGRAWPTGHRPN